MGTKNFSRITLYISCDIDDFIACIYSHYILTHLSHLTWWKNIVIQYPRTACQLNGVLNMHYTESFTDFPMVIQLIINQLRK